jgi:hypothetical protein
MNKTVLRTSVATWALNAATTPATCRLFATSPGPRDPRYILDLRERLGLGHRQAM